MSPTPWLQFAGRTLYLEDIPALLERSQLLKPLVRRLLLESCISQISVEEEEQRAFQQRFLAHEGITSPDELARWLESRGLSEAQASQNILESLQLDRFKLERFGSDVEKIFFETKDLRDRVVYSLLRIKDSAAANELYLRLEEGDATFTDLSQEHSAGPERETGGLIGPVPMGRLNPRLAEMLRIGAQGQLWRPIEIDGFWVIVRLDKKIPAKLDKAMEKQIREECFERWVQQQLDQFMAAYSDAVQRSEALEPPS